MSQLRGFTRALRFGLLAGLILNSLLIACGDETATPASLATTRAISAPATATALPAAPTDIPATLAATPTTGAAIATTASATAVAGTSPEGVVKTLWAQISAGKADILASLFTDDVSALLEGNPDFAGGRIIPGKNPVSGKQPVIGILPGFFANAKVEDSNYGVNSDKVTNDLKVSWPYGSLVMNVESVLSGGKIKSINLVSKSITPDPSAKPFTDASANTVIKPRSDLVMGEMKRIGDGVVQSYLKQDSAGKPVEVGVIFIENTLSNLSTLPISNFKLALPVQSDKVAIKFLSFDWYSQGLPGAATQFKAPAAAVPLFLFHAYLMTPDEAQAISPADPQFMAKGTKPVPPENINPDYSFFAGGPVPGNGTHIIDAKGPVFKSEPLRTGANFGYFDGKWTTIEPFFTRSFLQTKTDASEKFKLPQAYPKSGLYYPTGYSVKYDASNKEYTIAFDGLTLR